MSSYSERGLADAYKKNSNGQSNVASKELPEAGITDDREQIKTSTPSVLVLGGDSFFAEIVKGIIHKQGYKFLYAVDGRGGMGPASQFQAQGILLDGL